MFCGKVLEVASGNAVCKIYMRKEYQLDDEAQSVCQCHLYHSIEIHIRLHRDVTGTMSFVAGELWLISAPNEG
ncbi:unnamed protein product, partial [Brugia timori]